MAEARAEPLMQRRQPARPAQRGDAGGEGDQRDREQRVPFHQRMEEHQLGDQLQGNRDNTKTADMRIVQHGQQSRLVLVRCAGRIRHVRQPVEMQRARHADPERQRGERAHPVVNRRPRPCRARHQRAHAQSGGGKPADRRGEILGSGGDGRHRQARHELDGEDQPLHWRSPVIWATVLGPGQTRRESSEP